MNGPRTGFFAGSFDPPTLGHVDLFARAVRLVDRLVVGVGHNLDKSPWIPSRERVALLTQLLPPGASAVTFEGLAVEAAAAHGATLLVRGVRSEADMSLELQMALANRRLAPGIESVLLIGAPEVAHVSSRLVREVFRSGGDIGIFVPPVVAAFLRSRPSDPLEPRSRP